MGRLSRSAHASSNSKHQVFEDDIDDVQLNLTDDDEKQEINLFEELYGGEASKEPQNGKKEKRRTTRRIRPKVDGNLLTQNNGLPLLFTKANTIDLVDITS